jgi:flagellin
MSLRINSDTERVITLRNVGLASASSARAMERLSSGYRINRASDDASGLVISEKLRGQVRGLAQDQRNIQDAISLSETTEGALSGVHSMLQRIRELAVQYKNGSTSNSNAASIDNEVNAIASEIERTANNAQFNNVKLLSGSGTLTFQVGSDDSQVITLSTVSLGQTLGSAWSTLGATTDLDEIDAAIDAVSAMRANVGSVQNRLETTLDNVSLTHVNLLATESRIRDVDMAGETVTLARSQILSQTGTAMLAQANQASQGVLTLLH